MSCFATASNTKASRSDFHSWHLPNTHMMSDGETNCTIMAIHFVFKDKIGVFVIRFLSFNPLFSSQKCLCVRPICLYMTSRPTVWLSQHARWRGLHSLTRSINLSPEPSPSAIRNQSVQLTGRLVTEIYGTVPTLTDWQWPVRSNQLHILDFGGPMLTCEYKNYFSLQYI